MNDRKPVIAARRPFPVKVEKGKAFWWCACGRSKTQPFCDGSHEGTGFEPLKWTAEEDGTVLFCGCKHTKTPPVCDGSHRFLKD